MLILNVTSSGKNPSLGSGALGGRAQFLILSQVRSVTSSRSLRKVTVLPGHPPPQL